tara:strand:- start:1219 stop:1479 length:261 start_codon:yes stop_codon:yes gene_type:complete
MRLSEMKEMIAEYNQESLLADGFDDAIIGIVDSFSDNPVVLYDKDKCIDILCKDMSREEAIEYFNFNVMGAYMGDNTPKFAMLFNK